MMVGSKMEYWLSTEYHSESITLWDWIHSYGALKEDIARSVMSNVLHGLQYLHNKDIVHLDIKPANILLLHMKTDSDAQEVNQSDIDKALIIDFDSAAINKGKLKMMGSTWNHAAPEVIQKKPEYDGKTADIFSVGTSLFEASSAVGFFSWVPFDKNASKAIQIDMRRKHKNNTIDFERIKNRYTLDISDGCLGVVKDCINKDPKKRPKVEQLLGHPWFTSQSYGAKSAGP